MSGLINDLMESRNKKKRQETIEKNEPDNYTSFVEGNDFLAEQILNAKGEVYFCVYNTQTLEITYETRVFKDGLMYAPIYDEEVIKKAILLPSEAVEYGDDKTLDEDLKRYIRRWLDIPTDVLQFSVWNIKRSWVFERFHTLNYLRALGDTGQGKTRFLDTLGFVHKKPIATSGATTSAPIFRLIDKWKPTLIIDEADFQHSDETQDIIKIINQGYEKGKHIMRCDQNNANKINLFDPFCPKILATRRSFEDKATESRCITQVMRGTTRQDIPLNLNDSFWDETLRLRNKLLMWRFRNYYKINPEATITFDIELEPRVKQIVSSFASLFINDEEQTKIFKEFVKKHQTDLIEERQDSFDGQIVGAIYELLNNDITEFDSQDIIEKGELTDYKGNTLKPRAMTSKLKALGFEKTSPKKINGKTKRIIPLNQDLINQLFKRYGYEVTKVTIDTERRKIQKTLENDEKTESGGHRNNRNDRNSVTFDSKCLVWKPCKICQAQPTNEAPDSFHYCESCFNKNDSEAITEDIKDYD